MSAQSARAVLNPQPLQISSPELHQEPASPDQHDVREQESQDREADERELAVLAYEFWVERGCPEGSPDEDWFRAVRERQVRSRVP
jgi:hypothetical protein